MNATGFNVVKGLYEASVKNVTTKLKDCCTSLIFGIYLDRSVSVWMLPIKPDMKTCGAFIIIK